VYTLAHSLVFYTFDALTLTCRFLRNSWSLYEDAVSSVPLPRRAVTSRTCQSFSLQNV